MKTIRFYSQESVQLPVPPAKRPITDYLSEIDILVSAIASPEQTTTIGDNLYQLQMQPIVFLDLYKIQPVVTLKIWCDKASHIHIQSIDCQLPGLESLMQRFQLDVTGLLWPEHVEGRYRLNGDAKLEVSLVLPAPLRLLPKSLIRKTGDRILSEILQRIKTQLLEQLIEHYQAWAMHNQKAERNPIE